MTRSLSSQSTSSSKSGNGGGGGDLKLTKLSGSKFFHMAGIDLKKLCHHPPIDNELKQLKVLAIDDYLFYIDKTVNLLPVDSEHLIGHLNGLNNQNKCEVVVSEFVKREYLLAVKKITVSFENHKEVMANSVEMHKTSNRLHYTFLNVVEETSSAMCIKDVSHEEIKEEDEESNSGDDEKYYTCVGRLRSDHQDEPDWKIDGWVKGKGSLVYNIYFIIC